MKSAMQIKDISFKYTEKTILKNLNFSIEKGEFLGILGPNGCGKTTLLKNLCNLCKPYEGNIEVFGTSLPKISYKDLAKKVAVVHQFDSIGFDFSVYDIVLMGRMPYQKRFSSETKYDHDVVKKCMKITNTWDLKDQKILQISGGQRQRVMIARALAQEPDILILDEPISHLDIKHQINILNLCKTLNEEKGMTIIITIHDINMAAKYCKKIMLMSSGEIRAYDKPEIVLTKENIKNIYDIEVGFLRDKDEIYIVPRG